MDPPWQDLLLLGPLEVLAWTTETDPGLAVRIARHAPSLVVVLRARNSRIQQARAAGVVHFCCPGCGAWGQLSLTAMLLLLHAELPPWLHRSTFVLPPLLGGGLVACPRPASPAARLEVALPSGVRLALRPSPGPASEGAVDAWCADLSPDRRAWVRPGVRALVNAARALGEPVTVTAERPATDLYALDPLQYLLTSVPATPLPCSGCARPLLIAHPSPG
ncbi:MAG: hypothetical protein H6742_00885 [Alphaproteobacteria bacterium]|nr:hypothetical protein [Alphaproteobacteria bacterium]